MKKVTFLHSILIVVLILFLVVPISQAAIVKGIIEIKRTECKGRLQLWVSRVNDKNLLYQNEIVDGGTFAVSLLPGHYKFTLTSDKGCEFSENMEIKGKGGARPPLKLQL